MKINGNKILIFNFIILLFAVFIVPYGVNAKSCKNQCKGNSDYNTCFNKCKKDKKSSSNSNNNSSDNSGSNSDSNSTSSNGSEECNVLLGDKDNEDYEESVAWLVQKLLDYLKILGPILVVILSSVDFATAIVSSNDDTMKKAQKKLITRLIAAVLLFLIPTVVGVLLDIFGITSCNIY